jgi:hypothetical protein
VHLDPVLTITGKTWIGRADLLVSRGLRAELPEAARQRRPTKNRVKRHPRVNRLEIRFYFGPA